MAKSSKVGPHSRSRHFRPTSFPIPPCPVKVLGSRKKRQSRTVKKERKELEHMICSVCLEFPHNSVLLCSSYDKGCCPHMCAASYFYSNCFEQYKKAYSSLGVSNEKQEGMEPLCPFCRGEVKGWTVVEDTQKYLNSKKRTCMDDGCAFVGNYKGLRRITLWRGPKIQTPRSKRNGRGLSWRESDKM